MDTIPRVVNRMLMGSPLCRNEDYLKDTSKFVLDVVAVSRSYQRFTPTFTQTSCEKIVVDTKQLSIPQNSQVLIATYQGATC